MLVKHKHHLSQMRESTAKGKAPPSLTPKIKLTALEQTEPLTETVEKILDQAGLQVVEALRTHFQQKVDEYKGQAESLKQILQEKIDESVSRQPEMTGFIEDIVKRVW